MPEEKSTPDRRLRRLTPERLIPLIREYRGMLSPVAKHLGVSYQGVRKAVHRYPSVAEALNDAREEMVDVAEAALYRCIREGKPWAIALFLRTIGRNRGYVERQEITGADGDAIPIKWIEVVKTKPDG